MLDFSFQFSSSAIQFIHSSICPSVLLHCTINVITTIFLHHIQSYSIITRCGPKEDGCHIPRRASWNVTHVPCGCIIPPRIEHTAAGTDTYLFAHVPLSGPLPFPTSHIIFFLYAFSCNKYVLESIFSGIKWKQTCTVIWSSDFFILFVVWCE